MPEENIAPPVQKPTPAAPAVQPPPPDQPKTHEPILLLWILCFFIIVAIAGFILYQYSGQSLQKTPAPTPVQQTQNEKGVLRVAENIDEDDLAADTKEFQP